MARAFRHRGKGQNGGVTDFAGGEIGRGCRPADAIQLACWILKMNPKDDLGTSANVIG